eukprot:scaffold9882_cov133-Isochrysis_galbana.AAC.3
MVSEWRAKAHRKEPSASASIHIPPEKAHGSARSPRLSAPLVLPLCSHHAIGKGSTPPERAPVPDSFPSVGCKTHSRPI